MTLPLSENFTWQTGGVYVRGSLSLSSFFRHSFATHLLESGTNIRVLQKLTDHADVKTTEISTHVLQQNLHAVVSPLDNL